MRMEGEETEVTDYEFPVGSRWILLKGD